VVAFEAISEVEAPIDRCPERGGTNLDTAGIHIQSAYELQISALVALFDDPLSRGTLRNWAKP
jgi:hypothetical protein